MKRRILSAFLALVMLLSCFVTAGAEAPSVSFAVTADKATVGIGETVTFTVSLTASKGIYGVEAILDIPAGLSYVAGSGKLADGAAAAIGGDSGCTFVEGQKQIWLENSSTPMTVNGTVAVATFRCKALALGEHTVSVKNIAGMDDGFGDLSVSNSIIPCSVCVNQSISGAQELSGISAPVKQQMPDTQITVPDSMTAEIKWYRDGTLHTGRFDSETAYTAEIILSAKAGYMFGSDVEFTIDGEAWAAEKLNDGSIKLTKTFPATEGKGTPVCTAPSGVSATYGQKLSDIDLTNPSGNTEGTWSWMEPASFVGEVGTNTFKAKFVPADTANYTAVENVDVAVRVEPKNITVQIANIAAQTYTGSQIKPAVTVTGDGKTLVLDTDYTVDYGANINVGTGSVTVKSKSGSNYTFVDTGKFFDIVAKAGQISISGDLNVTYGTVVPDVAVDKHGSNGAVTVYYYTDAECTTGKTAVKPVNAGAYWAQAEMAAGANHAGAVSNVLGFTISRAEPICTAPTGMTAVYGQKLNEIDLPNPSGNTEGTWNWMTPDAEVGNVGNNTHKVRFIPKDIANYRVVGDIDATVTVKEKNITVQIANIAAQTYTGSQIKPVVTVTGDGKTLVLNTDYTVVYGANVNVGTGSVTVKSKSGSNYTFADTNKAFDIVAKKGQISISGDLNVTYGAVVPDVAVNKNGSSGAVTVYYYTDAECTTGKTAVKPTNAGSYWVKAEMAAGANHSAAESNVLAFVIARANITPAVSITGWTYKDSAKAPSVTGNTGKGTVTYLYKAKDAAETEYSAAVPVNVGTYTVKAEVAQTANYNAAFATKDFTIVPKTITADMVEAVAAQPYTGNAIEPVPAVKDGTELIKNTDVTYSYADNTYVGTSAKVIIKGEGNYTGTVEKTFAITVVDQTPVIVGEASVTRDGHTVDLNPLVSNAKGTVSFAISGDANGCTIADGVFTSGKNKGVVTIDVSISAYDANGDGTDEYNAYAEEKAIEITVSDKDTQTPLTITGATNVTCGQSISLTTEGGSGDGAVTYAVINGTGEATIEGNVMTAVKGGTVTVIATKAESAEYNSISSAPITITIEKIKVAIPAKDTTAYIYTGKEQTYRISENAAYTVSGNKQVDANEVGYVVTVNLKDTDTHMWADGTTDAKTYSFVIGKGTITITAVHKEITAGENVPTLGKEDYTVAGLADGERLKTEPLVQYETEPDANAAGTVVIKVSGAEAPDGGNYNDIVYVDGLLTINSKPNTGGSGSGSGATRYTVRFETNGGSKISSVLVKRNDRLDEPARPKKEGYRFAGWYVDKACRTPYDFNDRVKESFTLYAKWVEKDEVEEKPWFADVHEGDWYYDYVAFVTESGLMNGVSDTLFAPNSTLTRAMLVTVLYRSVGSPAVDDGASFADVSYGAYYADAVAWAQENGIVTGVTEDLFAPDQNITREQIAAIMYRFARYEGYDVSVGENTNILSYEDADNVSEYAIDAMQYVVGSGLMKGKTNSTLDPLAYATRAEFAAVLQRFLKAN